MHSLSLHNTEYAMISGVWLKDCKIKPEAADWELLGNAVK